MLSFHHMWSSLMPEEVVAKECLVFSGNTGLMQNWAQSTVEMTRVMNQDLTCICRLNGCEWVREVYSRC